MFIRLEFPEGTIINYTGTPLSIGEYVYFDSTDRDYLPSGKYIVIKVERDLFFTHITMFMEESQNVTLTFA